MSDDAGPILLTQNVRYAYPRGGFALDAPDLSVARGERIAIVGPSGCGKTTLLRLLTGVLAPDRGRVEFDGVSLGDRSDAERRAMRIRRVGMVFQEFALLDYLNGLDNILLPFRLDSSGAVPAAAKERARMLADRMGVGHALRRRPARLSQGERQRIAICRALVNDPIVIACDEPTGNLDPDRSHATIDLIFEQAAASGATVLVVTHNHALLDQFDRVHDLGVRAEAVP